MHDGVTRIADEVESDLKDNNEVVGSEFPVSTMGREMVDAVGWLFREYPDLWGPESRGLDMGTGSGLHALVMLASGFGSVLGLDACPEALDSARNRVKRLIKRGVLPAETASRIELREGDVRQFSRPSNEQFRLLAFNPPGFLKSGTSIEVHNPLERGVYEDVAGSDSSAATKDAMVIRFISEWAPSLLEVGGFLVTTWPLIQTRLAYAEGTTKQKRESHPLDVIERQSGWKLMPGNDSRPPSASLLASSAPIKGYGLGASLTKAMHSEQISPFIAHELINWPLHEFRFGVLVFQRTDADTLKLVTPTYARRTQ